MVHPLKPELWASLDPPQHGPYFLKGVTVPSLPGKRLAQEIYNQRFPYSERNSQKKQLSIKELEFMMNTSV
jgi:hypothetical protein